MVLSVVHMYVVSFSHFQNYLNLFNSDIQDNHHGSHCDILQTTSPKPYLELNRNLVGVGGIMATLGLQIC